MTIYYLVYDSLGLASERVGNFRSHNKKLNDNLANGVEYVVKRVPNELLDSSSACVLQLTEVENKNHSDPVDIVGNSDIIEISINDVCDDLGIDRHSKVIDGSEVVSMYTEAQHQLAEAITFKPSGEEINTRELAIAIAKEKAAHASVVSKAYDTGEPTSMAAYTDEIEDVVKRVLAVIGRENDFNRLKFGKK